MNPSSPRPSGVPLIGRKLSHYEITGLLGKGGMGEVYRAHDARLGRDVALKVLPVRLIEDPQARSRFEREARAVARLSHPNILAIYDVGSHEGIPFAVTEILEGETLRERLGRGLAPIAETLELAQQIADGLAAAHDKGVIHRDIKPENIFLTEHGPLKILDFGLAKLMHPMGHEMSSEDPTELAPNLTRPGDAMGTVSYMSPEQALGKAIDHRSDIFSTGLVIHEMVTGKRAYAGETNAAIFDGILNRAPARLADHDPPPKLQEIVDKALEKDPALRYQSMAELRTDLTRLRRDLAGGNRETARSPAEDETQIVVVLPFKMLAGGDEFTFLSLALAEAVSHALSAKPELTVRPTSAVAAYATQVVDPLEIARKLHAGVVVEGSIQGLGRGVRVQVQAWDAAAGSTRLSVKLDGSLDDLFGLQDEVAEELAAGLGLRQEERPSSLPTPEPRAYEQFLRASERLLRWSQMDTQRAVEMLRTAVTLDPQFADGWGKLSGALVSMGALFDPDPEWLEQAHSAIERALALDPQNPEAWTAKARLVWTPELGFRHEEALHCFGVACRHPACPSDAPLWQSLVLSHCGLHEESLAVLDDALEANPDDLLALLTKGEIIGWMGDMESFDEHLRTSLARDPSFPYGHLFLPTPMLYQDELERAEDAIRAAKRVVGDDSMLRASEALLWAKRGEDEKAHEVLSSALAHQQSVSHAHHTWHYAAAAHATLGEAPKAMEILERASRGGLPNAAAFDEDPHFRSLHEREDFTQFVSRLRTNADTLRRVYRQSRD